jgi:hypothetical protein
LAKNADAYSKAIRDISGTYMCFFIKLADILKDRKITYGKIVCDYKPQKKEKEHVRLTVAWRNFLVAWIV